MRSNQHLAFSLIPPTPLPPTRKHTHTHVRRARTRTHTHTHTHTHIRTHTHTHMHSIDIHSEFLPQFYALDTDSTVVYGMILSLNQLSMLHYRLQNPNAPLIRLKSTRARAHTHTYTHTHTHTHTTCPITPKDAYPDRPCAMSATALSTQSPQSSYHRPLPAFNATRGLTLWFNTSIVLCCDGILID